MVLPAVLPEFEFRKPLGEVYCGTPLASAQV